MNRAVISGALVLVTTLLMPFCITSLLCWISGVFLLGIGLGSELARGGEDK